MDALVRTFLAADRFAVVGASANPSKFGNKVRSVDRSEIRNVSLNMSIVVRKFQRLYNPNALRVRCTEYVDTEIRAWCVAVALEGSRHECRICTAASW